jgi:hypothetical protein
MKISLIIVFSVFLLLVFGCKMQVDNIQSGDKGVEGAQDVISFKGRVVYRNFEGGFWGIISDDGQRYDPLVLPEQFQIEGLRVAGKVRRRNVAHFHMWGTIVELVELKIIEDGVSPAIKELIDGFTYQLKDGKVVRLIGINSNKNAQDKTEEIDVDTNAYELPPQGTIIPCELCVILYPERYEKEPQTCLICQGAKEHFQPAQMMTREMAQMQLYELDLKIQQLMYQTIMDSLSKPVDLGQLKKMHKLYKRKLIHLLVYDFLEVEPVKENILQLDEMIKK